MKTNLETISYNSYINSLDEILLISKNNTLNEGIIDSLKGVTGKIGKFILDAKRALTYTLDSTKLETKDIIKAFKNKEVFTILKKFKFSVKLMVHSIGKGKKALDSGLTKIFKDIHNNKIIQKINSGAMSADDYINKHPKLKKYGGYLVAGLLLLLWLNMSYTGVSLDYDIDQSVVIDAFSGNYSLADLFTSPIGMKKLAFLALGFTGISATTLLGSTSYNLILSVVYTALKKSNFKDDSIMNSIKKKALSFAGVKESFKEHIKIKSFKKFNDEKHRMQYANI